MRGSSRKKEFHFSQCKRRGWAAAVMKSTTSQLTWDRAEKRDDNRKFELFLSSLFSIECRYLVVGWRFVNGCTHGFSWCITMISIEYSYHARPGQKEESSRHQWVDVLFDGSFTTRSHHRIQLSMTFHHYNVANKAGKWIFVVFGRSVRVRAAQPGISARCTASAAAWIQRKSPLIFPWITKLWKVNFFRVA